MSLPVQLDEINGMKRWICHQNKIPKNPITGGNAIADKSETLSTYEDAL